jgi:hypothetical protein
VNLSSSLKGAGVANVSGNRKSDVSEMIKDMQEIQFDFEKNSKKDSHDEEHNSSEIFVHQLIETIEFVLGTRNFHEPYDLIIFLSGCLSVGGWGFYRKVASFFKYACDLF